MILRTGQVRKIFIMNISSKSWFFRLSSLVWTRYVIVLYFNILGSRFISGLGVDIITWAVFAILALLSIPYMLTKLKIRDFVFVGTLIGIYVSNMLHAEGIVADYLANNAVKVIFRFIPLILVGICIASDENIDLLHRVSFWSIIANALFLALYLNQLDQKTQYMSFAYYILPHVCLMLFFSLQHKKTTDCLAFVIGFFSLLLLGTRGPILCIALFLAVYLMIYKEYKHQILGRAGVILLVLISYLLVLTGLSMFDYTNLFGSGFTKLALSLASGNFFFDNGRFDIATIVWSQIQEGPFWGYGVAGDRNIQNSFGYTVSYSHNIVLEFMHSFGMIFGMILFLSLIVLYMRGYLNCRQNDVKAFILVLLATTGFAKLFISGSYLIEPNFYLLIGLCIGAIRSSGKSMKGYRKYGRNVHNKLGSAE